MFLLVTYRVVVTVFSFRLIVRQRGSEESQEHETRKGQDQQCRRSPCHILFLTSINDALIDRTLESKLAVASTNDEGSEQSDCHAQHDTRSNFASRTSFMQSFSRLLITSKPRQFSVFNRIALNSIELTRVSPVLACESIRSMGSVATPLVPPVAKKVPYKHVYHGREFEDPYHWMRDDDKKQKRPEIMEHLEAEKAFATARLKQYEPLKDELYKEMLARIQEDDVDVPVKKGDYYYYKRTEKGKQYPYYCRKKGDLAESTKEEIVLDQNTMKEEYIVLGSYEPSPNHKLLAYSLDTQGNEFFTVYVKDLETGKVFEAPDVIENTDGTIEWSGDSKSFYYMTLDDIQRPDKLFRHILGQPQSADEQLYHETDEQFRLGIGKTNSERYILVASESGLSSEIRIIDAEKPEDGMKMFHPRTEDLSYSVDHQGNQFLVLTNDARTRINYRLISVPVDDPSQWGDYTKWTNEVIPYDPFVHLTGIECFKDYIAVFSKADAITKLRIIKASGNGDVEKTGESYLLDFPEEIYALSSVSSSDQDYNASKIRFSYASPITVGFVLWDKQGR